MTTRSSCARSAPHSRSKPSSFDSMSPSMPPPSISTSRTPVGGCAIGSPRRRSTPRAPPPASPPQRGRIAVAHTRDDRVETFLMRAITGSGAAGLSSIPYVRGRIVRPLLDCDRAEVRAYLRELGQEWREDASNADTSRLRALVRARIVPVAEQVNPAFRETLSRSIDLLAGDDALLSRMADDFSRDFAGPPPRGGSSSTGRSWRRFDPAMARRTVRSALIRAFPEASRLEAAHIEAVVDGLSAEAFARDLPGGLRAETEYGKLVVSRAGTEPPVLAPSLLPLPGNADLGQAGSIVAEQVDPADIAGEADSVTIDAGNARTFVVDAVHPGDRMRPLGMDGSRKLSDLLMDAKVPRRTRGTVPVVRDGDRIVWLAGVRMSEEYRVGPEHRAGHAAHLGAARRRLSTALMTKGRLGTHGTHIPTSHTSSSPRTRSRRASPSWARRSAPTTATSRSCMIAVLRGAAIFVADLSRADLLAGRARLHGGLELRLVDQVLRRGTHPEGPRRDHRGAQRARVRGHPRHRSHAEVPAQEPGVAQAASRSRSSRC